ncbi:NAD+ synthase [Futiania mangrovi]|uniref:Glutamine-dependent NAD(+) synthetase n=1 Tax=Futiania mangrovi TaxID=2959716 RepID=A0A9J6PIC5_9PROT|nr:NAD+ synthase [Futiania mangrovii]MCP1335834.1 NAD+ synthase [Futiania mangrovii]
MTDHLRIALVQADPTVGDLAGNLALARAARAEAAAAGADLVVLTECFLSGYPQEDLVLKPAFVKACMAAVEALAADTADGGPDVVVGVPWAEKDKVFNAALHLAGGGIEARRFKHELPNYGVFDEPRVFAQGPLPGPVGVRGVRVGVMVCEDMWAPDVTECLEETGAEILVSINASPFEVMKHDRRLQQAIARVTESGLPLVYVNQLGGQDELVFDGGSFVLNGDCSLAHQMPAWTDAIRITDWRRSGDGWICETGERPAVPEGNAAIYQACMRGLRDYVRKNRFPSVVLGLSGGIDSALTAAIAADALGPDKVHTIMLPSRFTSGVSLEDAQACADALGVHYDTVSIAEGVAAAEAALAPLFGDRPRDVTEENLQSRMRGLLLMGVSNKLGSMLLTTGNKSEVAVGYATLYGDMCGGFNPLKDLYKTQVFALSEWRNQNRPEGALGPAGRVIPQRIIDKPPTAELRENQKDEDSLPPYDVLDAILRGLVDEDRSVDEVTARGFDRATVARIEHLVYIAEYKRRQAAPGVKISPRNFGRDRRYPITNAFRDARQG